ncbi:SGS domain-containing protein [Hirsutella rhossiliensis]|uniref:SGS domain-containing protein n=1 Tax=Hirsutella rhossiliensis TaxID=111463 RepID=A0A9P8N436_9HYPO|nr:SGS domain-containing protein [Hirsutella rhossiliensis]KAH0968018.1 SGS domain-containing protein [Hirsutella rhossiliensis]
MAHITLAQQGLAAVEARRWDEAVAKLSQALQSSYNPAWLVARSKAFVSLKRFAEALDDADVAWHSAYERNKRPFLIEAHYRRAVAYYRMGQYANADCCCIYAMRLVKGSPALEQDDPKAKWTDENGFWTATMKDAVDEAKADEFNRGREAGRVSHAILMDGPRPQIAEWRLASTLRMHILRAMETLPADDEARKVTVSLKPEHKELVNTAPAAGAETEETTTATATATQANDDPPAATKASPVPTDAQLRLQEFQSGTTMVVSVFSKGVDKEKLQVEFLPFAVHLDPVIWPNGEEKKFSLLLWGEIDPSASKYSVTPNKVELKLAKKTAGKWPQLQKAEDEDAAKEDALQSSIVGDKGKGKEVDSTSTPSAEPKAPFSPSKASTSTSASSYPSSSRSGPKDWDKIATDEDEDEDERDINLFFKRLYRNANPAQQRAMTKSFMESNGTSLSTDWESVKARMVETVPPEGVEAKKWE